MVTEHGVLLPSQGLPLIVCFQWTIGAGSGGKCKPRGPCIVNDVSKLRLRRVTRSQACVDGTNIGDMDLVVQALFDGSAIPKRVIISDIDVSRIHNVHQLRSAARLKWFILPQENILNCCVLVLISQVFTFVENLLQFRELLR